MMANEKAVPNNYVKENKDLTKHILKYIGNYNPAFEVMQKNTIKFSQPKTSEALSNLEKILKRMPETQRKLSEAIVRHLYTINDSEFRLQDDLYSNPKNLEGIEYPYFIDALRKLPEMAGPAFEDNRGKILKIALDTNKISLKYLFALEQMSYHCMKDVDSRTNYSQEILVDFENFKNKFDELNDFSRENFLNDIAILSTLDKRGIHAIKFVNLIRDIITHWSESYNITKKTESITDYTVEKIR